MFHLATSELTHFLTAYGYWAVLFFVAIESAGIPLPGESMLLVAAIYAGTTHRFSIPLVIAAAASGAILGNNLGYWVGREGGYRLLRRYGRYIRLDERKLKLGQYLFRKHGGKVVFFGRFIAVLRTWAASWLEPTVCRGDPSCSSTRSGASSGPHSTGWEGTSSAIMCID
ncbi:MAG: DedA family protein [Ktedonobacteraceae bacterium]